MNELEKIDIAFEVQNYFSRNNFNNNDLSKLTLIDIHEHAKELDRQLSVFDQPYKYTGELFSLRQEMVSFINHALGIN